MRINQLMVTGGIIFVIVAVGAGIFLANKNSQSNNIQNDGSTKKTEIMVNIKSSSSLADAMKKENSSADKMQKDASKLDVMSSNSQSVVTSKVTVESGYTTYNSNKLVNAQYGKVILFFHATWCPSCKGLDTDIKNNLGNIPNDTLILKVDYDSNPELKSKYKVTSQHTLVQVNQNGDLIKSSPGLYQLNTLDSVLKTF
ncbi:MAG: thioredoxin family protein [bacterium]